MTHFQAFTAVGLVLLLVIVGWLSYFQPTVDAPEFTATPDLVVYQRPIAAIPTLSASASAETTQAETLELISASSYMIRDASSAAILLQKNPDQIAYPASTAKLMTALVARENYTLDVILQVPKLPAEYANQPALKPGESYTVESLLKALLINSNNVAAYTLAYYHPQGYQGFIDQMNKKAQKLTLTATIFDNPAGFDSEGVRSTATDLSLLTFVVLQDESLRAIVGTVSTTIEEVATKRRVPLSTTNLLMYSDPTIKGIKTGTTVGARQVLITYADRQAHPVIVVLLDSKDRYADTRRLLTAIYELVAWQPPQAVNQAAPQP